MKGKYQEKGNKEQAMQVSDQLGQQLSQFLEQLLIELDAYLDKRLVRTLARLVLVIVQFRHNRQGLVLSELGGYLLSPERAPAGTKRISNLLRSRKWHGGLISSYLWRQGDELVADLQAKGERALCLWDESVLEKPESIALEGLCPVRSSTARRLKRIKPGFYNPPTGRPVFVPGMQWVSLVVTGLKTAPRVAAMRWWSSRGPWSSQKRSEEHHLLTVAVRRWGPAVLHIFDRGFAGGPWLALLRKYRCRFVLRWPKKYQLIGPQGKTNAWKISRGKRSQGFRHLWDANRRTYRKTGILALPVSHPNSPQLTFWLVISRPGKGRSPWYLLTSEPIHSLDDAWDIVFAYARRWQIEMVFRFTKSELAFESPRLWSWHNRLKLLLIATLAYAFLLSLLTLPDTLLSWLLRHFCHRTGKRHRAVSMPLYRLRIALSRLWLFYPPALSSAWENPG